MNKICFFLPPYPRVKSWFDMVDVAAEYGHTGVEGYNNMELATADREFAQKLRAYADSKGVRFCCFSVGVNLVDDDNRKNIQKLKDYAHIAAILGAPYLHHTIAVALRGYEQLRTQRDTLLARGIEATREVYDYAQTLGIRTVVEDQGYIFNGIDSFRQFVDTVDRDIGLLADVGNIYQCGDTAPDFIRTFAGRFVHSHIKDVTVTDTDITGYGIPTTTGKYMNLVPVGQGTVPLGECLKLLKDSGFDGWYSIEHAADRDDSDEIDVAVKLVNDHLNDL